LTCLLINQLVKPERLIKSACSIVVVSRYKYNKRAHVLYDENVVCSDIPR